MLNTNSGIDPSSARAFGTTFPAGQNQGGANAFGLGGRSRWYIVCRVFTKGGDCDTVLCRRHPRIAELQHAKWFTEQVLCTKSSMLFAGACAFQSTRATNLVCLRSDILIETPVRKWSACLCRGGFGLPSSAAQQQAAQQNRFAGSNMGVNLQPVRCHLYPKRELCFQGFASKDTVHNDVG